MRQFGNFFERAVEKVRQALLFRECWVVGIKFAEETKVVKRKLRTLMSFQAVIRVATEKKKSGWLLKRSFFRITIHYDALWKFISKASKNVKIIFMNPFWVAEWKLLLCSFKTFKFFVRRIVRAYSTCVMEIMSDVIQFCADRSTYLRCEDNLQGSL